MRVGYVGLGAMGRALARHLAAPFELVVRDLNPVATAELVALGADEAGSLGEMAARCGIVLLCLPKSANVENALFDPDGLAAGLAPGSIVVDQTSGVPGETRRFAERLAERGVVLIDAPVAGGVPSALAGQITIMASGPEDAFERARPVLEAISPKLFLCSGRVGDGQATKAVNNLVNAGNRMATLELLGLARRLGCRADALTTRLNAGPARSFVTQRLLPAVVEGRSSADFSLGLMCKDANQAADLAAATRTAMPVSDAARSLMATAHALIGPDGRLDDLVPFMERLAGTTFVAAREDSGVPAAGDGAAGAIHLIERALAAINRAVIAENAKLADAAGLDVARFAPVMAAGSGSSAQAEALFAGEPAPSDALEALDEACRIGAELGVPLAVTSQARAHHLNAGHTGRGTAS